MGAGQARDIRRILLPTRRPARMHKLRSTVRRNSDDLRYVVIVTLKHSSLMFASTMNLPGVVFLNKRD